MVEQMIEQWVKSGGKGVPVVLFPKDGEHMGWTVPDDRLCVFTNLINKVIVTNLDAAVGFMFGSIVENKLEEKTDATE